MHTKEMAVQSSEIYGVPMTIEGYSVLHEMFRVRWAAWNALTQERRAELVQGLAAAISESESKGMTAAFAMLGHKADLMLIHFRESFAELNVAEVRINRLPIIDYLKQAHSYLSMVELGLYESSMKLFRSLTEKGIEPHSEEWNKAVADSMERQKQAMSPRLFPKIPETKYVCFYPMDRKRGEEKNWYTLPIEDRGRQLNEHGTVGRRYADSVRQIITGSIGFDDWEWGVDLFADNPLVYKKLITEMRYDEVSAVYSNFGTFFVGLRVKASDLGAWIEGKLHATK